MTNTYTCRLIPERDLEAWEKPGLFELTDIESGTHRTTRDTDLIATMLDNGQIIGVTRAFKQFMEQSA